MSDLQWKIEDGTLWVFGTLGVWRVARPGEVPAIMRSAIRATQEKCAQWHDKMAGDFNLLAARCEPGHPDRRYHMRSVAFHRGCASAIRALKMETGHE